MHREFRKPLIIMTPKSLLRHKRCISNITEFVSSSFHRVLEDDAYNKYNKLISLKDSKIKKVVICSGKIYYDLIEDRKQKIMILYL